MFKKPKSEKLYNEYKKRGDIGCLQQLIINERTLPISVRDDIVSELDRLPRKETGRPEISQVTYDNTAELLKKNFIQLNKLLVLTIIRRQLKK